jgi:hypothetical protein
MVRPLKAAKPPTTSWMSALSQVTVMRGACDCAPERARAPRYSSIVSGVVLGRGVVTRAAAPPRPPGAAAARPAADRLDHDANAVRSESIFTCTCPSRFSIR